MTCAVDRLALLPDELLLRIFSLLQPRDIVAVLQTCHNLKRIAGDFRLWFNVYDNEPLPLLSKQTIEFQDARKTISEAHLLIQYLNQSGNSQPRRPPSFRFVDDIVNSSHNSIHASYLVLGRYLVLAFARSSIIRCYDISEAVPTIVRECPLLMGPRIPIFICSSSLNNPTSDGWMYLPIQFSNCIHVYRLALPSFNAVGPLLHFFTQLENASLLPAENLGEYLPLMVAERYRLFSPALNQMCELKSETQRSNARVILAPQYAILWWPLGRRTIFEVFMFPESSALSPPNVLNITHRGQLDVRCRYCLTMQYLNKCDSSLLLTTETVHDDSSSDPYSPTYRLAVYRVDFQNDGHLGLKELHCFSLRNPSYLLWANTVIKRHGMIFLISLQPHNPHYIVLTLQCDTTGKDWEFEFKKESMTVLHVEPPYNILCNVTKGELLWIDQETTMFKHRLIDETQ